MTTKQIVLAFDIYGTLLSTDSICKEVEKYFDEKRSRQVAELWRRYQLEYSWRLTTMDCYSSFQDVTKNALVHALRELDSHLDTDDINQLLTAYNSIATFHDVDSTLERIAQMPYVKPVIFSNGTADMLSESLARSSVLNRHRSVFKDVVSVDDIRKYKPAREVYEYLAQRVRKVPAEFNDIWLVSGNPFDVIGARNVGLRAIWVDRAQKGWKDQAMPGLHPTAIVHQLEQVVDVINNNHVQQNAAT